MHNQAKFEKVSYKIFSLSNADPSVYQNLKLPGRATVRSAGYDFFAPANFELLPGQTLTVPTGIRAFMPDNAVLLMFPRSGLGFKYKLYLDNTVGVIDADYSDSDNEGHIFIRMTNGGDKILNVKAGEAFAQGIFVNYLLTEDDSADGTRNGGMGSTDKKT